MGVFPRFGGWINLNTQQPLKAESGKSENVESTKVPPIDPRYYDQNEVNRQIKLWRDAEKKHPWTDAPPKVTKQKGLCHMNIEMSVGYPPEALYEMFANPNNEEYSRTLKDDRPLLVSIFPL
ncbi:unnamed protein product [Microthlaspi erraticum]|uniref:Uncharacterized protein n=1 Tax=Microthlaspi erraticum TaxID=1685480 RepID=A0A6D2J8F4_9BRAS|nr:unnamed protein product [Microthlaspi erraticum]